jgi:hypothetical protein
MIVIYFCLQENFVQLIELSRDLSGYEGVLTEGDRQFIRQGCLAKFSQRKGYQQRMFFLVNYFHPFVGLGVISRRSSLFNSTLVVFFQMSDLLLYSNLCGQSFRVHGQMPVRSLTVQERVDNPTPNSFSIYSGSR